MRKNIWSPEATLDLQTIYRFYLSINPTFAKSIYKQIRQDVNLLKKFPTMAPIEPLLERHSLAYRSLPVMGLFKVIYYTDETCIYITNIWDCRKDPQTLLKRIK